MSGRGFERDAHTLKPALDVAIYSEAYFPRAELSRGEAEASSRTRFFEGCKDESLYS